MEDILLAHFSPQKLTEILSITDIFEFTGINYSSRENPMHVPMEIFWLSNFTESNYSFTIFFQGSRTINKLFFTAILGHLNWIRPSLGIPTYAMFPFFQLLQGNEDLISPRLFFSLTLCFITIQHCLC